MVVSGFYLELVANPSKYTFPWFAVIIPAGGMEAYNLEELNDPSPEYMPPLPPYREKSVDIVRDDAPNEDNLGQSDNQTEERQPQERNVFRIE